jgi:hypothetical protein
VSEVKGVKVSELDPKLEEFASVYSSFVFCIFLMGAKMQTSVKALILLSQFATTTRHSP